MPGFAALRSESLADAEARVVDRTFALLALILFVTAVIAITGVGGSIAAGAVRIWLSAAVYVLVAAIVALRAVRHDEHRRSWTALAVGLALYAMGNLIWSLWLGRLKNPPIPSICDPLWLSLYPLSYAGLVGIARVGGERRTPARLWLDAIITGAGLAALGAALVFDRVLSASDGSPLTVVTELAYPVCDLLLAGVIVGVLALRGWRLDRKWALLAAGFLVLALADCMYAVEIAGGAANPTTMTNLFYMLGVASLAVAAWQLEPDVPRPGVAFSTLLLPAMFMLGALGLLVVDHFERLDPLAFSLAIATLLAAIVRLALAFKDVRSLVEARRQAATDDLTALPNRRMFIERTRTAIAAARLGSGRLSVMILDLDNFKELNETLGHDAGDALLRLIGPRLRRVLRSRDTVARLGGDEFGILLDPLEGEDGAGRVARKLLHALSEPFAVEGLHLRLTASIGIASFPEHADSEAELMRRADVAMYLAKTGRSGFELYAPERDTNSRARLALAGELAIALDLGGIEVHFQPKGDAITRQIVGVEALIRWRRRDGALWGPGQFLHAAEQAGLSRALTRLVLGTALDQVRVWRDQGHELHVAVNTTVADLLDDEFPNEVAEALAARELPPDALVIEVTERSMLSDPVQVGTVLARLGEIGVGLSLDDFGTGYSSLSHLRAWPVGEIKIDRSFVAWMCSDDTDAAIVYAMVQLAHKLGVRVVAEGVEDAQTWRALAELECELIQGYALSRPVPADELESRLLGTGSPEPV